MKTFITAATVAVLAFVVLEIAQIDARGGDKKCPASQKPPLNNTVKCDAIQIFGPLGCRINCLNCYKREQLNPRNPSCLSNRKCVCIGNGNRTTTTTTSTTVAPTSEVPVTSGPVSEQPSTVGPPASNPPEPIPPTTESA